MFKTETTFTLEKVGQWTGKTYSFDQARSAKTIAQRETSEGYSLNKYVKGKIEMRTSRKNEKNMRKKV